MSTQFVDGVQEGDLRVWHPSGGLQALVAFSGGKKSGLARNWSETGQLLVLDHFVADEAFGLHQGWYPDGSRSEVGNFAAGKRTGPWFVWDVNGALDPQNSGVYAEDRRSGPLGEEDLARAAELHGKPSPLKVKSEVPDPLQRYDLKGDPLAAGG